MADPLLSLPTDLRSELKEPMGPVYTDATELLSASDATGPLVAVGDVVTHHLLQAGTVPTVAVVDERTQRGAVDDDVRKTLQAAREDRFDHAVTVDNPAATLTEALLEALAAGIDRAPATTVIAVDGEEDLATLPALLLATDGAVVYGQPEEGMVLVEVDEGARSRARELITAMDGDPERALALLDA